MTGPKLNEAPVRMRQGGRRGDPTVGSRASVPGVRGSAWKMRAVLDLIRGHSATEAANILRFCERDAAEIIGKLLASAVANAQNNEGLDPDELYVSACFADEGASMRRWSPRARGRADRINKYTSHVTVIVSRMPADQLEKVQARSAEVAAQRARRTASTRARAVQQAGDTRREATGTTEAIAGATMTEAPADQAIETDAEIVAEASVEAASVEAASVEAASVEAASVEAASVEAADAAEPETSESADAGKPDAETDS